MVRSETMTDHLETVARALAAEITARYPSHSASVARDPDIGDGSDGWMITVEKEIFVAGGAEYAWYNLAIKTRSLVMYDDYTKRVNDTVEFEYANPDLLDALFREIERSVKLWL